MNVSRSIKPEASRMAHFFTYLFRGTLGRGAARSSGAQFCALFICFCTFVFAVLSVFSAPTFADAWLDRVERNLRRIESASKTAEPVRIGSRAAKRAHGKCTRDGDLRACEQIIWRQKELLPIEDWAVGTAHIKRGEMREKVGDVEGALEDYRDALGYHKFYSLTARIKRLTLRQQRKQKKNNTKISEKAVPSQDQTSRKSTAIVEGWTPKFQTDVAPEQEKQAEVQPEPGTETGTPEPSPPPADGSKSDDDRGQAPLEEPPSHQKKPDDGALDVVKPDNVTPPQDVKMDVAAKPDDVDSEDTNSLAQDAAPSPIPQTQRQEASQNQLSKVQAGGATVVEDGGDLVGDGAARIESQAVQMERAVAAELKSMVSPPASTDTASKEETLSKSDETQSARPTPVGSTRVTQTSGDPDITTAALPSQATDATGPVMRDFEQPLMMALIALILASSLVLVVFNRERWWGRRSTETQDEPTLSVEDLELLITQRSAEAPLSSAQKQTLPFPRPPSSAPPSAEFSLVGSADNDVAENGSKADSAAHDARAEFDRSALSSEPAAPETQEPQKPTSDTATEAPADGSEELDDEKGARADEATSNPIAPTADEEQSPSEGRCFKAFVSTAVPPAEPQSPNAPPALPDNSHHAHEDGKTLRTLLRRVSFGATSVIVAGSNEVLQATIAEHVDAGRRSELMNGLLRWESFEPRAAGSLNPFDFVPATGEPRTAGADFEKIFGLYTPLFDTLFGADFVEAQRDVLQHLVRLLHAQTNPSLSAFRSCLEDGRTDEAVELAQNKIDQAPTQKFLTTTFLSDDFDEPAAFMGERLADVLSNAQVKHLCGEKTDATSVAGSGDVGRVMFLPLEDGDADPTSPAVLLRCLFAVLRLQQLTMKPAASGEGVAVSLYIPELAKLVGGDAGDVDFFVTQLKKAGYDVL